MHRLTVLFIAISLHLASNVAFSQSDTPCGAPLLTLGSSCTYVTHDASGDTKGTAGGTPSCGLYGSTLAEEDTWYAFVAPAGGSVNISSTAITGSVYSYASAAVYSGPCASLTEITCFNGWGASVFPSFSLTGLTPGQTYYVRFWGLWPSAASPKTHGFCAYAPPSPPSNDECSNATSAVVDTTGYCIMSTPGTIDGATQSSESYYCGFAGGGSANDDVWFSFVATANTHYFFLENIVGSTSNLSFSVHAGTFCNTTGVNALACNQDFVVGLTVGATYFVRVWSNSSSAQNSTFDLCITTAPDEPSCATNPVAGNTACSATAICNLNGYCGTTSATYSADSWAELFTAAASCFPDIDNNSFLELTAIATEISFWVWVDNCDLPNGIQIMVFSANACGSGPIVVHECYSPGNIPLAATLIKADGLTIGDQYYIMIDGNAGAVCDYKIAAHEGIELPVTISATPSAGPICLGSSIDLYAAGGAAGSYTWSPTTNLNSSTNDTVTSTPTVAGSYTYTATSMSVSALCPATANDFTFTVDPCILPVELLQFDAIYQSNEVLLNWATASEINNDYFTVERSTDGVAWEELSTIDGAGNSSSYLSYTTCDKFPHTGVSYYRLSHTDLEGRIEFSEVRSVEVNRWEKQAVTIYPNPATGEINIIGSADEIAQITIYDMLGQDLTYVTRQTANMQSRAVIDLSRLPAGVYWVKTKSRTYKLYRE